MPATHKTTKVTMDAKASVLELKLKIQEIMGLPLAKQKLIHVGKPVEDSAGPITPFANTTVYVVDKSV